MTWTYDEANIDLTTSAGRLNAVRAVIQDTDSSDQLLQNEEIAFFLVQSNDDIY